ncbi:leucine-rich repeat-containing protein 73-like [Physella acuta]|uniref:leucine-rich repeat-containing protein 73-like n=1 Tax=Physella acuta TaxID=109671 RepID=UPI0027DDDE5C|nr:leucine-rich repeat-containing protein 73-like [Physella acuta]
MVTTLDHIKSLSRCLRNNKSLTGLHIHGSDIGDAGMHILHHSLCNHPGIVSLDVGDCKLGDMSIDVLYSLMLPANNKPGITELTLSDNPRISALGWAQFAMCLANCSSLKWLFLDYNTLGDYGASCVLVGMAASQSVEILDMEGCGLTEHSGQAILHLVQNHLGSLSKMNLSNNRIRKSTIAAIMKHINENNLQNMDTTGSFISDDMLSFNSSLVS